MDNLLSKVNSAICNIDGCLGSAGYNVVKSDTYGRKEKKRKYGSDLTSLSLIKSRLKRYRDVFLTDNCWPPLCNPDPCNQTLSFSCTDFVSGLDTVHWLTDSSGNSAERWGYNSYVPDRGTMISMTKADDDGSFPFDFNRIRFYEWDNCKNTFEPVSGYIDTPDRNNKYFIYLPSEKRYYVFGSDWILVLDENFVSIGTVVYGGSRSWRGMTYDETRKEFYLCDNLGNKLDILNYDMMTITSTTSLPTGTPTTFNRVRVAGYRDGGLILTGWTKVWHLNVDTQAVSLVFDGDGTDYYYGTPKINPNGDMVVLRTDIANNKIELQQWYVDANFAFPDVVIDLDLSYRYTPTTTALIDTIEYDSCGNMYFVDNASPRLSNSEHIVLYDKNYKKQVFYTDRYSYGQESPFSNFYNPASNKFYIQSNSPSYEMLVLDIKKETKKKVNIYPDMCTPFTEKSVCDLINVVNKICADICK